jgi:hypothetical protein
METVAFSCARLCDIAMTSRKAALAPFAAGDSTPRVSKV